MGIEQNIAFLVVVSGVVGIFLGVGGFALWHFRISPRPRFEASPQESNFPQEYADWLFHNWNEHDKKLIEEWNRFTWEIVMELPKLVIASAEDSEQAEQLFLEWQSQVIEALREHTAHQKGHWDAFQEKFTERQRKLREISEQLQERRNQL